MLMIIDNSMGMNKYLNSIIIETFYYQPNVIEKHLSYLENRKIQTQCYFKQLYIRWLHC